MAILLTGAGGLFTRLGKLAGALNDVNTFRGGTASGQLVKATQDLFAQLDGDTPSLRNTVAGVLAALPAAQTSLGAFCTAIQTAAQKILVAMANSDTPLVQQTAPYALALLKAQMLAAGDHVTANTVGAAVTPASGNTGNGAIVCGVRDKFGYQLDNLIAETIAASVTATAAGGGTLQLAGALVQSDPLSWAWPAGSGCNKQISSLDPAANTAFVSGGNFDAFVANLPSGWTAATGTAATDFGAAGAGFKGANALKYIGGTGVLSNLTQNLGGLSSRTPYAINCFLKADVVPASGTLVIDLYNGASVIQDESGNNCSLSIALNTLTTSYAAHGAIVTIADPLPSTVTLRLRLSAAVPSGSSVFVDQLTFQPATQIGNLYGDTIWAAACTGSVDWSLRDTLSIATTNNRTCLWQQAFDRLFGCRALGFVLPTSGSTLINDSLISD